MNKSGLKIFSKLNFLNRKRDFQFRKEIYSLTGYWPVKIALYKSALTHKSVMNLNYPGTTNHNERLEYLGDAILNAVITDYIFAYYPDSNEGFLTKMRSRLVNRANLNRIAVSMQIEKLININSNIIPTKKHIFGNALEAVIGAVYLDKGYKEAKKFVADKIISSYSDLQKLESTDEDFKSKLIQWGQQNKLDISFASKEISNDNRSKPFFCATIQICDKIAGEGTGFTKKEAQQHAAQQALNNILS